MRLEFLALILLATACSTYREQAESIIEYGCKDAVVVGRAKTLGYSAISNESDIIDHGAFDMEITIERVLYGDELERVIPAYGIAHAPMRDDKDFAFVLTPKGEGFEVQSAYLWSSRPKPRLADSCMQD